MKEIPLTQGYVALVDDEDYEEVSRYTWYAVEGRHTFYAKRTLRREDRTKTTVSMHHQITGYALTDHKNGNGVDNRRTNLREATGSQNQYNSRLRGGRRSSRYMGVGWKKGAHKWVAQISATMGGSRHTRHLGYFTDEEEAARAYDAAAHERDPEFCRLNFPEVCSE